MVDTKANKVIDPEVEVAEEFANNSQQYRGNLKNRMKKQFCRKR